MISLEAAIEALEQGRPIVLPTDTVYGVGVIPSVPGAVEALFQAKRRTEANPLPVLGDGVDSLAAVVRFDDVALEFANRFWPGPLTLVLRRAPGWNHYLGGSECDTVAVRVPKCEIACELLARSGPLAVSSANRSGGEPATTVAEAREALRGFVDVYLDGGTRTGAASTVLSLVGPPTVLREGPIPTAQLSPRGLFRLHSPLEGDPPA